jgi:hypothetical protein
MARRLGGGIAAPAALFSSRGAIHRHPDRPWGLRDRVAGIGSAPTAKRGAMGEAWELA